MNRSFVVFAGVASHWAHPGAEHANQPFCANRHFCQTQCERQDDHRRQPNAATSARLYRLTSMTPQ